MQRNSEHHLQPREVLTQTEKVPPNLLQLPRITSEVRSQKVHQRVKETELVGHQLSSDDIETLCRDSVPRPDSPANIQTTSREETREKETQTLYSNIMEQFGEKV